MTTATTTAGRDRLRIANPGIAQQYRLNVGTIIEEPMVRVRLVRERPNWRIVVRGSIARWETVWRDEPVDAQELTVTAGQPVRFARSLAFARSLGEFGIAAGDHQRVGCPGDQLHAIGEPPLAHPVAHPVEQALIFEPGEAGRPFGA